MGKKSPVAKNQRGRSVVEAATAGEPDKDGYVVVNGRRIRMIAARPAGTKTKKKRTTKKVVAAEKTIDPKKVKTKLTAKELRHYRSELLLKRAELLGDLDSMETAALRSSGGDLSSMPIHMADVGSDAYDQDLLLGMAESERERVRDIDDALVRISNKTYGVCQLTGEQIPKARLDAKPWAKYTIEAARKMEGQGRA